MIQKSDFKKIHDYLWEIPKSFRKDMRVPARAYVDEKQLEESLGDRSFEQLVNLTALPGIQKYSIAMPDVHEGYGSPVGGVAAMDAQTGVISPGMVGYDINCIHPAAKVILPHGTYISAAELVNGKFSEVAILNKNKRCIENAMIALRLKKREAGHLLHIKSKFGFSVKVTADHPFYNGKIMKKAGALEAGDKLIVYPFIGAAYEPPRPEVLISREKIIKALRELGLPDAGNSHAQILAWFTKKDFLNLRLDSPQTPYLIKALGYLFGDGTVNMVGKNKKGNVGFYGGESDLTALQADIKRIGLEFNFYKRQRTHLIRTHYRPYGFTTTEYSLHSTSTSVAILFYLLGAPLGNKTETTFFMPNWIKIAPKWQKKMFLAAFFGAEMSKPATMNKYNFYAPTLNINKVIPFKKNGTFFIEGIKQMLSEFAVKTTKTVEVEGLSNKGKTIGLRFQIYGDTKNLIRFFSTVGFEYHKEKQKLANSAAAYLQYKDRVIHLRNNVRTLVRDLYRNGVSYRELVANHSVSFAGPQFIEHSIWSKGRDEPRIAFNFPSFEEFVAAHGFGDDGCIVDEVESVEKEPYGGEVYDITVRHPHHNFIANNFVVSNCGVRLLRSELTRQDVEGRLHNFVREMYGAVPSGLGHKSILKLGISELDRILAEGVPALIRMGYGDEKDLEYVESSGHFYGADPKAVSEQAKKRGRDQLGTLGSGNHFGEVGYVEKIFDKNAAKTMGLSENQVTVLIHTGSRGLGHQIATDYIREMMGAMRKYGIELPDRELAATPFSSPEGKRYFSAMKAGAHFAWANRELIAHSVRRAWVNIFGKNTGPLELVYDVAHNMAKLERYALEKPDPVIRRGAPSNDWGETLNPKPEIKEVIVHRKGATRSFGPGHPEIPEKYKHIGQPVLIPGSMGTASYVLVGEKRAEEETFASSCHGAGRTMSRHQAKRMVRGKDLQKELEEKGIHIEAGSYSGLAEEAPLAYKNVDRVVEVVEKAGIAKRVARLKPIGVIKG